MFFPKVCSATETHDMVHKVLGAVREYDRVLTFFDDAEYSAAASKKWFSTLDEVSRRQGRTIHVSHLSTLVQLGTRLRAADVALVALELEHKEQALLLRRGMLSNAHTSREAFEALLQQGNIVAFPVNIELGQIRLNTPKANTASEGKRGKKGF